MPRIPRVVIPNMPHHVTQRGARKQQTFFGESDYRMYVDLLARAKEKSKVEIWAYCLMPNHVHLVVVPDQTNSLARLLRETHGEYARRINQREGWQGHLWQERYHSFVMDENHLLATVRYVERNPVRAGLCSSPDQWPWSSVHAYLSGSDDDIVSVRPMQERIVDWMKYLSVDNSGDQLDAIRSHTNSGRPIGSPAFMQHIEKLSGRKFGTSRRARK
ncbi:MAG: REP-associated tyrosine transposase [Woeseiaceae bacterium]